LMSGGFATLWHSSSLHLESVATISKRFF